jgi:prepilin signal peptidase PulO-like enzyme (type II secretory pathway)
MPLFYVFLFILGGCFGSFFNVVIFRYEPDKFSFKRLLGRSRCRSCGKTLRPHELIPLVSFFIQGGKCRSCRARLSWQYPLVELLSGLAFVLIPFYFLGPVGIGAIPFEQAVISSVIWTAAFLALILISAIDLRFQIIPDSLNGLLAFWGLANILVFRYFGDFGLVNGEINGSFFGHYALLFWLGNSLWINYLAGAVFGLVLFGGLHFLTKGKGMGFGDAKLAAALGLLFGWPDTVLVSILSFIVGSLVSVYLLLRGAKRIKDRLPFGPFLAIASGLVFFFGYQIVNGYFSFFNF